MKNYSFPRTITLGVTLVCFVLIPTSYTLAQETTAAFKKKLYVMIQKMKSLSPQKESELLSPYNFEKFTDLQKSVTKRIDTGGKIKVINEELNEMQVHLDKIAHNIALGKSIYDDLLQKKYQLSVRYKSKNFLESIRIVEDEFTDGGEEIEDNDMKGAKNQKEDIREALFNAEVSGAKDFYFRTIKNIENLTDSLRPEKKFPHLHDKVQTCKEALSEFLEGRPGDIEEIEKRSNVCNDLWYKLKAFLQFNKKIIGNDWEKEEFVVYFDSELNNLFKSADKSIKVQLPIQEKAAILNDLLAQNLQALEADKITLNKMKPQLEELERLRKENLKREDVRKKLLTIETIFDQSIALVRRDNSDIVIDVYGLTFKLGSYEITSEGFPLLEKIKNAVALFKGQDIELIGHTDSDGNPISNKKLSKQRAETLMKFLKSAGVLNTDHILVDGKGDASPLHPNTSWDNKRRNRRVEVRIKNIVPL